MTSFYHFVCQFSQVSIFTSSHLRPWWTKLIIKIIFDNGGLPWKTNILISLIFTCIYNRKILFLSIFLKFILVITMLLLCSVLSKNSITNFSSGLSQKEQQKASNKTTLNADICLLLKSISSIMKINVSLCLHEI